MTEQNEAVRTESDVRFWLRKLFDTIDTDATIQREKRLARDPMRPPRADGIAVVSLQLWENFLRPQIVAALATPPPAAPPLDVERLRSLFRERGWSIVMEDNEYAVFDPFAEIARLSQQEDGDDT